MRQKMSRSTDTALPSNVCIPCLYLRVICFIRFKRTGPLSTQSCFSDCQLGSSRAGNVRPDMVPPTGISGGATSLQGVVRVRTDTAWLTPESEFISRTLNLEILRLI